MRNKSSNVSLVILLSLLIALILTVMPLPYWLRWFRPEWLLLVVIFWTIAMPHRVGLFVAWTCGLILDVLYGSVFGAHPLAFIIVVYFVQQMYFQIRSYPRWQQAFAVFILCLMYQCCILLMHGMLGQFSYLKLFWLPAVTSMFVWPGLSSVLNSFQQKHSIIVR